jgi:hypothetical protein
MGNSDTGSYRPSRRLSPAVHWQRDETPDHDAVIAGVHRSATVAAVFDSRDKAEACLRDLIDADLGLSVNVSASVEGAKDIAAACSIGRHSVEYSLGLEDPQDLLPEGKVLELTTMCGHGMVAASLARKMIDMVRQGRRSPDDAARTMARFCPCGVYNPARAKRLLRDAR